MESGEVDLRSGNWTWRAQELIDLPTGRVETRHFFFRLTGSVDSLMRLRVPGDSHIPMELFPLAARHPFMRKMVYESEEWTFHPVPRPPIAMAVPSDFEHPPYEVVFRSDKGGHGRGRLPPQCGLGDVTDEELQDIIEQARQA